MASFFEQQAQARSITTRLLILFGLAVVAIVATITFITHVVVTATQKEKHPYGQNVDWYSQQQVSISRIPRDYSIQTFAASMTLLVIGIGSIVRMAQIGGNGTSVALMLGGTPISGDTDDELERRLVNVVEEMAIASSVPVPKIFVMKNELGINAFAAGTSPSNAVVGVTRGTLESLTRDELQGVVAHEFSHIFNGDMKMNLRLIGVLGGILSISTIGRLLMRADGKDAMPIVVAGFFLFVLGYIGVFFGRLIKAAVSRQREYLADASAIQYTRNPLGIGGALMKIRDSFSNVSNQYAEEASHMFFERALRFSSMMATHPPLEDRITRISPTLLKPGAWTPQKPLDAKDTMTEQLISQLQSPAKPKARPIEEIVQSVGAPQARDLVAAQVLIQGLPEVLRHELHQVDHAREILLALLLEPGGGSAKQHALIQSALGPAAVKKAVEYQAAMGDEGRRHRLSILQLTLPAFRALDVVSKRSFLVLAREVIFADQRFDLFEYVSLTIIESQIDPKVRRRDRSPTKSDVALVMSALAYAGGGGDVHAAKVAFDSGLNAFNVPSQGGLDFCSPDQCKFEHLSPAVWRLAHAKAESKRGLIEACVRIIMKDGHVTQEESELLHAVCSALEAPLPVMAAS